MKNTFKTILSITLLCLMMICTTSSAFAGGDWSERKIQRKNSPKNMNRSNKKSLKKWGLAEVIKWEEVANAS